MKSPKIKIEIKATLTGPNGKVIKRYPWKRANSLLKAFIQVLITQMSEANQVIKDTGGVDRNGGGYSYNFACGTGVQTDQGIVIGTGTTAVTMTDHKLETQVTTNIVHQQQTYAAESPDTSTWRVATSRGFINNTGSTLSIKEVGLYVYFSSNLYRVCIDRTLYAVDVSNGATLTLTYRLTVTL